MAQPAGSLISTPIGYADWHIRRMHVVPMNLPVYRLSCREAWNELTETQKHFVHHFSRASWNGSRICAKQLSQNRYSNRNHELNSG
ncbi:hypothetical protein MPTK1_5g09955 [Marchantia polymorpha subsp. ruderalis]